MGSGGRGGWGTGSCRSVDGREGRMGSRNWDLGPGT